jgi:hypothetical protein
VYCAVSHGREGLLEMMSLVIGYLSLQILEDTDYCRVDEGEDLRTDSSFLEMELISRCGPPLGRHSHLWGTAQSRIKVSQSTFVENDHTSFEIWVSQAMTLEFGGFVD